MQKPCTASLKFAKAYEPVRRVRLPQILKEFNVPPKLRVNWCVNNT